MQHFFSIITVCFNDFDGLKNTYLSIKDQTKTDFEWIVVDGASKDGTIVWLRQLNEPRLKWSSESDKGIFDAMNKGTEKATGEYLIFMNAGDEFCGNDILEKISGRINQFEKRPVFVYGDAIDVTASNKSLLKIAKPYTSYYKTMFTSHQAMLFNKEFGLEYKISYPLDFQYTADYAYVAMYLKNIVFKDSILRLEFPICKFALGGTNEIHRIRALKEDYKIRTQIIGLSKTRALALYLQHFLHTLIKKSIPALAQLLRYKKPHSF
jgi:putative colanic acid biosynthesis glycosyltransferase